MSGDVTSLRSLNQSILSNLKDESDRAVIIIVGSLLENSLEDLLKSHFLTISELKDPLFNYTGSPLSSFDSKIKLSYRLGLISSKFAKDMHCIRDLRNSHAHSTEKYSFEDPSTKNKVISFIKSTNLPARLPKLRSTFDSGIRGEFIMVCSWMLFYLNSEADRIKESKEHEEEVGYIWITEEELEKMRKK